MCCGPAGALVAVAFMSHSLPLASRGSAAPTSLLHFDGCAIAMTAEIKLLRSRGWPRYISLLTVSLGRAPDGHVERAPRSYAGASGRSTARSAVLRWKRLLLVPAGPVTKCTSPKDSLSVRRCPVGG